MKDPLSTRLFSITDTVRRERVGLAFVGCAVLFNAWFASSELRLNRNPLNDLVYHQAASERMAESFARGEPFLDPWVSEWALGYPVWRTYQPLPHIVAAVTLATFQRLADPAALFSALYYMLLITFPISMYIGARLLGLPPAAAGLSALLSFGASAGGVPGQYGLSYGSFLWRGSGLYTQLFAFHPLVIAMGLSARAMDHRNFSRRWSAWASISLAVTALSHLVCGYAVFVSAAALAVVGPRARRSARLVRLAFIILGAALLLAWFVIPLLLAHGSVNHSRFELPLKWDSFGAPFILHDLLSGRWFDFGRAPLLSLMIAAGVLGAILSRREALAQRLLALTGLWLVLFFGRETWGHLMILAGVPADFPLHRLQAVFEMCAILLAAYGIDRLIRTTAARTRLLAWAGAGAVAVAVFSIAIDRAGYLEQNTTWGDESLAACDAEHSDLDAAFRDVRAILAERPGRVHAGLAATWGGQFKIGSVPVYAMLSRAHFDEASFLYHSMSKTSDPMIERDENNAAHDVAFGIRAIVAPSDRPLPSYLRRRSVHGRFAVYESSSEGYFGLVNLAGHYAGPSAAEFETTSAWLKSPLLSWGEVISLDSRAPAGPAVHRWEPLPAPQPAIAPDGRVLTESKIGEQFCARIQINRPSYAFVKITWNPDLRATVDSQPAQLIRVTPGFGAIPLTVGVHDIAVTYQPSPLKPLLLVFGFGAFALLIFFTRTAQWGAAERIVAHSGQRLNTPALPIAATLMLMGVVALHPLFRGKLIEGHDSAEYPPRLVEMQTVVRDGHLAPIWAPDLSAGHGQPLFQFSPPLIYWAGMLFRGLGFGLTDSLQFGLALLHLLGALATYGIARRLQTPRYAAIACAVAWLFSWYLCLDLYVRAAFAESAAVAVAPIALYGLLGAFTRPTVTSTALGALAVALVMLAHSAAALLLIGCFTVLLVAYCLLGLSKRELAALVAGAGAIAGGLGLTAFFWYPSLQAFPDAHLERLADASTNWTAHIIRPMQLGWSVWRYGLSAQGPRMGLSFALSWPHLILAAAALWIAWRFPPGPRKHLAIIFGLLAASGALLSTSWTSWIWEHSRLLQHMIYPWRAHMIPGLFLPLLTVFVFERVGKRWTIALVAILAAINLPHTEPKGFLTYDDEYYSPQSIAARGINTTTFEEFEPQWVKLRPPPYSSPLLGISSPIEVTTISTRTASQHLLVRAHAPTLVESSIFFYPGWHVTVDGAEVKIAPAPIRGTIQFTVPAGEHRISLELNNTPDRLLSFWMTGITLFLLLAAISTRLASRHRASARGPA